MITLCGQIWVSRTDDDPLPSPCVPSKPPRVYIHKRPHVYGHHAHVCFNMCPWCRHTRRRVERTHGHMHSHTQHHTQHHTETETELDRERQRKTEKADSERERQEKMKDERQEKTRRKRREDKTKEKKRQDIDCFAPVLRVLVFFVLIF